MGYAYRIYEKGKNTYIRFVPRIFTEKVASEFLYFDYFTLLWKDEKTFCKKIKAHNSLFEKKDIVKIYIGQDGNRSYSRYNPVYENPYLERLFETKDNKFLNIRSNKKNKAKKGKTKEKKLDKMTIEPTSEVYKEMHDYIFNNLENKELSDIFFKRIYDSNKANKNFRNLLNKYSKTYLSSENSNEDIKEIKKIKEEIEEDLEKYLSFRAVAISRYEYERQLEEEGKKVLKEVFNKDKEKYLEEYNKNFDEYLDSDEYEEMGNGDLVYMPNRNR